MDNLENKIDNSKSITGKVTLIYTDIEERMGKPEELDNLGANDDSKYNVEDEFKKINYIKEKILYFDSKEIKQTFLNYMFEKIKYNN